MRAELVSQRFFRRIHEIDMLRALAVLGVVENHVAGLCGGFLGVDVFFVISGYVITLLMLKEISQGTFSISDFYHHRIARIIPPLFSVSLFIYLCSKYIFWIPKDYEFIRQSFKFQAFFAQNIFFAERFADYFQGLITAKLNLHFWSLAVEEQFYIIYPLLFLFGFKFRNTRWIKAVVIVLLLASLLMLTDFFEKYIVPAINYLLQVGTPIHNASAMRYYLLPTRFWELLLGATFCIFASRLHLYLQNKQSNVSIFLVRVISAVSVFTIVFFMVSIRETMAWPNLVTLIPAIATSLFLVLLHLFGPTILPWIANNRILLTIGRSSYSFYLWHWPLLGILLYTNSDFGSFASDHVIYYILVAAFTATTYLLLEKNRHYILKWHSNLILLTFVVFSIFVSMDKLSPDGFSEEIQTILQTGMYVEKCDNCEMSSIKPFIVLWGDSHSKMLVNSVEKACSSNGLKLMHIGGDPNGDHKELFSLAKQPNFKGVILAYRWSKITTQLLQLGGRSAKNSEESAEFFRIHLQRLIAGLPEKPIFIFQEIPSYPFFPQKEAIMEWRGLKLRPLPVKTLEKHMEENRVLSVIFAQAAETFQNVQLVNPAEILCPNKICGWRDGWNLLYYDDNHLSVYGADKLFPLFSGLLH
jgi:peptidoglycan/LPS O-acetylase OafA/YrhL